MREHTQSPEAARKFHDAGDAHGRAPWLADVLLGGQDGLVNVLGVVLGVAGATGDTRIVLAAGIAATLAESVSMAAVAYTSSTAARERYEAERAREYRHIDQVPEIERDEVRALYAKKGFSGELLERIVETITSNRDVWVAVMLAEEHGLAPIDRSASVRSAIVVGVSSAVGSIIPLVPFLLLSVAIGSWASVLFGAAALFAFGAYKARLTVGRPVKAGLVLAAIGTASALVGWLVGLVFRVQ